MTRPARRAPHPADALTIPLPRVEPGRLRAPLPPGQVAAADPYSHPGHQHPVGLPAYLTAPVAAPARPAVNAWAIVAASAGALSLLLLPILLCPVAIIAGLVGHHQAHRGTHGQQRLALVGILLGLIGCLIVADRMGALP